MIVHLGNANPLNVDHVLEPAVYTWNDGGGGYTHEIDGRPNGRDALLHVLTNAVTRLPGHECFLSIVRDFPNHSPGSPTWVDAEDGDRPEAAADLALMLSEAYDIPVGTPHDVEETHHTLAGPPGVGPAVMEA